MKLANYGKGITEYVIKNLFGTQVILNVNVINHVILENTCRNKNKCRNKIVDKLVEKCNENIDGNEMIYNKTVNAKVCNSCTIS